MPSAVVDVPAGLENVAVASTSVSDVRGEQGFYHYRGYDAADLARRLTVEDAWYLLLHGDLPASDARESFVREVRSLRVLPDGVLDALGALATRPGSLQSLAAGVLATAGTLGWRTWLDQAPDETRAQAMLVPAVMPTIAAALWRLSRGEAPLDPDPSLGHAANFLWMVNGEVPQPRRARALERYMTLTVDHGFNNSTFASRVIASSGADLGLVTAGAIGALSGPLHGGAPALVREMLDEIATPGRAEAWVRDRLERGERIMGFGHRVYRTLDPRSEILHAEARELGPERTAFAEQVEATILRLLGEHKPGRALPTNVEFYAGVVLELSGLPPELFVTAFCCSRAVGWMANVLEQVSDNRIFRPVANYVGPEAPRPVPAAPAS